MKKPIPTDLLLDRLVADAKEKPHAFRSRNLPLYLGLWVVGAIVLTAVSQLILPIRSDLVERAGNFDFVLQASLWLWVTLAAAVLVYRGGIPGQWRSRDSLLGILPLLVIGGVALAISVHEMFHYHEKYATLSSLIRHQIAVHHGGCGAVIFLVGIGLSAALAYWTKNRAAPTALRTQGAWIGVATGALASFMIQFACPNETGIHTLFWHFLPWVALVAFGFAMGRKILRW
jgi:hypothetical protein